MLIVDEALSVGDAAFQRRALERIRQLQSDGVAILLVSHDMALVRRVCDRAVWLDHGQVVASGRPQDVVAEYLGRTSDGPSAVPTAGPSRRRCVDAVRLLDEWSAPATSIVTGAGLIVEVDATLPPGDGSPLLQVRIVRSDADSLLVDTCTALDRGRADTARLSFERLDLAPGAHRVEVAVYEPGWTAMVDEVEPLALEVRGPDAKTALLDPPHRWTRGGIRAEGDPSVDTAAPPSPPH